MRVKSYASSSKGNCYVVSSDTTSIVVDIGYAATKLLKKEKPSALLITHYHGDHVSGLEVFQNHCNCPVYHGLFNMTIGDLEVQSFPVNHDIESFGYTIIGSKRVTIILDTGIVTKDMQDEIDSADILIIESNYDEKLIHLTEYPEFLKERIMSDVGHLSNQQVAESIKTCPGEVYLAHMSEDSNFGAYAKTVIERLSGKTVTVFER